MKILYLDAGMGAAGDMLTAALLELLPDPDSFVEKLNALGIPDVQFQKETVQKCGITGTHMTVTVKGQEEEGADDDLMHEHHHDHERHHDHEHHHEHEHEHHHDHGHHHHHSGMGDIEHIVRDHLQLPEKVKQDVLDVYRLIAEAESTVHRVPVTEIHFHEVGTMDAVADVAAVCLLMNELSPDEVVCSPVHVGSGHVHCAHGILPVPAPATAHILKGIPIYSGRIRGELCTPTGAALLKHFVTRFGEMPVMQVSAVGYGMGKKDFEAANCIRAMLGESEGHDGFILELSCNVDDMTGEQMGFAMERLFEAGALDVYTVPIGMKKCRPGMLIRVMCREEDKDTMVRCIFKYTTTIGIREQKMRRYVLNRTMDTVETPYGEIRRKNVSGYGVSRSKLEYEDLAKAAVERGTALETM